MSQAPLHQNNHNFQGMKVLIVEDVAANIDVLRKGLKELDITVYAAPDGEVALDLVDRIQPDLILLDVNLPGIDGYEVCRRLKADPVARDIPVIFITAMTRSEDIVKGYSCGGVDYVTKPFRMEETIARVNVQLRLRKVALERFQLLSNIVKSEKLYRSIVDKIPELIFELDSDRRISFANPAFLSLGYEPRKLLGQPVESLIEVKDADKVEILEGLATKFVGPLATQSLEVVFKTNKESGLWEEFQSTRFLVDAQGIWDVSDEEVFQQQVEKNFYGTLCIGRKIK